jgi:iron(III) transport system substrate-binding protein
VVLYCAQDQEFAAGLLDEFRQQSGLAVAAKFDTEQAKSVSLYKELVQEKARPRCDVFWNNEILSTIRLQRLGLLEPYDSPSAAAFPAWARAPDHTWTAFAQRARVLLVNTDLVSAAERPGSLLDLTSPRWRGRVVMAKPWHGTSLTQAVALFEVLGPEGARKYYQALKANGLQVAPGNKQAAEWVGAGHTPLGEPAAVAVTDTDDAMAEVKAGRPVALLFPDGKRPSGDRMGTLFIPNTVALMKGCPNPEGGRRLVDFLLSPEVEAKLALADSHQIPVNPKAKAALPAEVQTPKTVHAMQVDWYKAADLWDEAEQFLHQEFAGP